MIGIKEDPKVMELASKDHFIKISTGLKTAFIPR
jgi:hypothetical protein